MTRLAIFDLDETITRRPTFLRWLLFWVRREAPWRAPLLILAGASTLLFRAGLWDRQQLKSFSARMAMGRSVSTGRVLAVARAFAAAELRRNVMADAIERIADELGEGRRVVIASASFEFYVSAFAEALGLSDAIGTRAVAHGEHGLRPRVEGINCYDAEKLERIRRWMEQHGIARESAHIRFFSDHFSDIPTLAWADEAIVVNPAAELAGVAREQGWQVVRWH